MRSLVVMKQNTVARKQKALKDPKTLTFYFGMNVVNRACDGMFVYNCSRLIKMYQRIGPQQDSSMMCRGVVGIVDVPYMVLEPTHNKQDFADAKEFRQLMRAMADHLMQYWDDLAIDKNGNEDTNRFWKSFGYLSARWRDPPSDEEKYARKRYSCVSLCVQCDKCLKWRVLPYSQNQVGRDVPDNWQCRDNPDQKHRRCDTPEEDMSPPMGVLKRKIKTKEQRQAELEAQIRKKQEELEQILDPDDEPSFRGRASSKRQSRASSPPHQPAKKAHSTAASPTGRTITVADRKRMGSQPTTTPAKSSPRRPPLLKSRQAASVSSRSTVSSDVNQSRSTRVSSSRRIIRDQSSESEEESTAEEDDEEVLREKLNEATVVSTTNNGQAATTFPPFDTTSTAGSGESNTQTKIMSFNVLKSTLNKDTGDLTAPNELKTPEANAKTSSFIANGEVTKFSPDTTSKRKGEIIRDISTEQATASGDGQVTKLL
uniref:CW-type domain-containing protein n=1 Tax=Mesocestoides corti TaxID=53468 RepID=A0A5K3FUI9_MESCO